MNRLYETTKPSAMSTMIARTTIRTITYWLLGGMSSTSSLAYLGHDLSKPRQYRRPSEGGGGDDQAGHKAGDSFPSSALDAPHRMKRAGRGFLASGWPPNTNRG